MQLDKAFSLKENGFTAEIFNSESTLVLDETGGPAVTPLYLIIIRNIDTEIAYRLKGIYFCSECLLANDGSGKHNWTDAVGKAKSLAVKVQSKGVVDLNLWQPITAPPL
jgi:hypothetical protein